MGTWSVYEFCFCTHYNMSFVRSCSKVESTVVGRKERMTRARDSQTVFAQLHESLERCVYINNVPGISVPLTTVWFRSLRRLYSLGGLMIFVDREAGRAAIGTRSVHGCEGAPFRGWCASCRGCCCCWSCCEEEEEGRQLLLGFFFFWLWRLSCQ